MELYLADWAFDPVMDIDIFADQLVLDAAFEANELSSNHFYSKSTSLDFFVEDSSNSKSGLEARSLDCMFDMEALPFELRRAIISFLDTDTLKDIRLTSRIWAELGEDSLITRTFLSLSYRDDASRLLALAKHPRLRNKIQTIQFLHGEIDEYYARHNTYFLQYMQDPDIRSETQASTWSTYAELKALKQLYLPKSCDEKVMEEVFAHLSNLTSINVGLMICPFTDDEKHQALKEIWGIPSTRLLPRVATTERFTNLVSAIATNRHTLTIRSLTHDRLPFEFFAQKPILMSHMTEAFRSLTTLDLGLDYSNMPNALHRGKAFANLSICIRAAGHLQSLSIQFIGGKKQDIAELLGSFESYKYVLPTISYLALRGISSREIELGNFLVRQKETLKSLYLGGVGLKTRHQPPNGGVQLREGSFVGLFERVRDEMELERLVLQGDLVGVESRERWILEDEVEERDLWEFVTD